MALEAYGASHVLQEILTVKSDDTVGSASRPTRPSSRARHSEPGVPESFRVLIKELQSLALDIKVLSPDKQEIELKDLEEDIFGHDSEFKDELVPAIPPEAFRRGGRRRGRGLRLRRPRTGATHDLGLDDDF